MKTPIQFLHRRAAAAIGIAALGLMASTAQANGGYTYPAGVACSFPLTISSDGTGHRVERTFYDRNGNIVRMINNGTGPDLTLANADTGASITLQGNGANFTTKPQADGTMWVRTTGHVVLIMFPTDSPPGPTTTLYVGQLVYTYDPNTSTNYTVIQRSSGRQVDICKELS